MDRTEFEKVSGGPLRLVSESGACVLWCHYTIDRKSGEGVLVNDVPVHVESITRLRHLLHGLGIKCDWDEPVTFERLIALPGATEFSDSVEFGTREKRVQIHCPGYDTDPDEATYFFVALAGCSTIDLETMRQVHLLLEAAGVGG